MPLVSLLLHDLHNSFDIIKSELLLATSSSSTADDGVTHLPRQSQEPPVANNDAAVAASNAAAASITKLKQQIQSKEERIVAALDRVSDLQVQLQERDAVASSLIDKCSHQSQKIGTLEDDIRNLRASLQDEKKQVIVLTERCNRHVSTIAVLHETEATWRTWVELTEAQAASTRDAVNRMQASHLAMLATCERVKRVDVELDQSKRQYAELSLQHAALQGELRSVQAGAESFRCLFASTADVCRRWTHEASSAQATMESLQCRLEETERQRDELQSQLVELSCFVVATPLSPTAVSPIITTEANAAEKSSGARVLQQDECAGGVASSDTTAAANPVAAVPRHQHLDDEVGDVSFTATRCATCAMLESRLLEATINVAHREEIIESLRQQLDRQEDEQLAPMLSAIEHQEVATVDRVLVHSRWVELESLISALLRDECQLNPPAVDAQAASSLVPPMCLLAPRNHLDSNNETKNCDENGGAIAKPSLFATLVTSAESSAAKAVQWTDMLDKFAAGVQVRDQRIVALEQHVTRQHHVTVPPKESVRTATTLSATSLLQETSYCGICGWEVHGRRPMAHDDDHHHYSNNDMAVCRLCGDCFHKTCCRQSEALFVCHKHTTGAPTSGSAVATNGAVATVASTRSGSMFQGVPLRRKR